MPEYNEWKIHDGSDECPAPEGTMGQMLWKDESPEDQIKDDGETAYSLSGWRWQNIFAYRTVKEPKVVAEGFVPVSDDGVWGTRYTKGGLSETMVNDGSTRFVHIKLFDNGTVTAEVEEV